MIKFYCISCGQEIQVSAENAGRQCKCPKCQAANTVPNIGQEPLGQEAIPVAGIAQDSSGQEAVVRIAPTYAGFWLRFVAAVIDSFVMAVGGMVLGGFLGCLIGGALGAARVDIRTIQGVIAVIGYISGIVMNWLYSTLLESSSRQATLGKMALGLIVTDMDGNRISFARANGRYWGKIISGLTLFIGYIMAGFTEKKQALHDMMAGCLVVKK